MKYFLAFLLLSIGASVSSATIDDSIVYIECLDKENKIVSRGSGVVVSENGHVLSARHVFFPKDVKVERCRGSIKTAESNNATQINVTAQSDQGFDAAIGRFSTTDDYKPLRYCEFDDATIRTKILVSGFPGGTRTGKPSFRAGIISTTFLDPNWMVETDGLSAAGMSGGPVVTEDGSQLVGLVAGADYNMKSEPTFYGITPVSKFAYLFRDLEGTKESCSNATLNSEQKLLDEINDLKAQIERLKNPFVRVLDLSKSHIVSISCRNGAEIKTAGTGLIVSNAGHVLTAGGVLEEGTTCYAQTGTRSPANGYQLHFRQYSANRDALILQMDPDALNAIHPRLAGKILTFRKVTSVDPGSEIAVMGFPTDEESGLATIERGYLATNFETGERTVEAALDVTHGLSGAPILDANSDVIGIISSIEIDDNKSISFVSALSSDYIVEQFRHLIRIKE